jgi:hypothetical protein
MQPELSARLAGQAADFYRAASRSFADATWSDIDRDFPWSIYIKFYTACFDAASFWQFSQKVCGVCL